MLVTKDGVSEFPACKVQVLDTTCAGDSFVAGFLFGVSRGLPLDQSVRLGNAAGGLCTTQISHRGITCLEDVNNLMTVE
jgi:sugar/nucleoside kinase (ribokinase family)